MGILQDGSCGRCFSHDGWKRRFNSRGPLREDEALYCKYCGASSDRVARRVRRRKPIGGKRGRNSGVHGTSKKNK